MESIFSFTVRTKNADASISNVRTVNDNQIVSLIETRYSRRVHDRTIAQRRLFNPIRNRKTSCRLRNRSAATKAEKTN
jgi:hypothetical protein